MKQACVSVCATNLRPFSTLDSGLRDETRQREEALMRSLPFSTLDSGLRDETRGADADHRDARPFSTLDSGLRDETGDPGGAGGQGRVFQYPRLGSTR